MPTRHISQDTLRHLYDLEESLWRPETRFDRALMERTFAPDFFEFGRSGRVWSRAECLEHEMQPIAARLPLLDFAVHVVAENVMLVTYVSAVTYDGAEEFANRSSIWRRIGHDWQLCFHQGTPTTAR
jgi:hypothetical protein